MNVNELTGAIEALLFASAEPVPLKTIANILEHDEAAAEKLINLLNDGLTAQKRGIKIIRINDAFQMCSNPDYSHIVEKLRALPRKKNMSSALTETLAIIAYKGPVSKTDIEALRGVDASHAVNKLLGYGLITEAGRSNGPGRPILFVTTDKFLTDTGFASLKELPDIDGYISG